MAQGTLEPRGASAAVGSAASTGAGAPTHADLAHGTTHADLAHGTTHADLAHGTTHAVARYNPDAPSEAWGWHGHWRAFAPKSSGFLLWLGVALLFCLNLTTHQSHVETWYYNGIAILMAVWLISRNASFRRARRRARPPVGD